MKTAQAHNAQLTGAIDIIKFPSVMERMNNFEAIIAPGAFIVSDTGGPNPVRHPYYWQATNYKRVLDPESGFYVYPWELTPTWRDIKKVGRGNVSSEAT